MMRVLGLAIPLFILMDFIGTVPVFISLVTDSDTKERVRAAVLCSVLAGVIVLLFAVAGRGLLDYFQISIEAVRVGGGVLLLYISIEMIMSGKLIYGRAEGLGTRNVIVSPLAIPMLAGPGSMTYGMVAFLGLHGVERLYLVAALALCVSAGALLLALSGLVQRLLGQELTRGLEKITAVVVSFVALEMILGGVKGYFFG